MESKEYILSKGITEELFYNADIHRAKTIFRLVQKLMEGYATKKQLELLDDIRKDVNNKPKLETNG